MQKKSKPEKKEATATTQKEDIGFQSFLVPRYFRNQSVYRHYTVFRFSLFLIVTILCAGGLSTMEWLNSQKATVIHLQTQNLENEEATRLQTQANAYRPVREKFKELESLRRQLRVPLAPLLDAIEQTIPPEISINRFSSTCPPIASTSTLRRKMQAQIEVFIPLNMSSDNPVIGAWPETIAETLEKTGLLITEASWGPDREYKRLSEDSKRKRVSQAVGTTKELNLTLELSPE